MMEFENKESKRLAAPLPACFSILSNNAPTVSVHMSYFLLLQRRIHAHAYAH